MQAKNSKSFALVAALLLILFGGFALLYVLTGWVPVVGNLISSARLRTYAAQVYPDLEPQGHWAGYDLVGGEYLLDFTLKGGGGRRDLGYDLKSGLVNDERRETVLRMDLGIAKSPQVNGQRALWQARWDPRDPNTPVVDIRIDFGDRCSAPVPDEETMREAMADRAMELYEELSPRTPVHSVSVHYNHETQEDKDGGPLWHIITVDLPEDTALTREMVLSGKLIRS